MALVTWQATIQNDEGQPVASASIEVRSTATGTPLATLYSNSSGTSLSNPFTTSSDGFGQFFVQPGEYTIAATAAGSTRTWTVQLSTDNFEVEDASEFFSGTLSYVAGTVIRSRKEGFAWEAVTSGGHVTVGGQQYIVLISSDGTYNVKSFNAKGDNTTDDTAAISQAESVALGANSPLVYPAGTYLVTNFFRSNQLERRGDGANWRVGSTVIPLPVAGDKTQGVMTVYVSATGSDTANHGLSSANPYATVQYAVDSLPSTILHDSIVVVANGTYTNHGGTDEFGRPVLVDMSKKTITALYDTTLPALSKAAKLIVRGESESGVILDGQNINQVRYGFWCHDVRDVQIETLTVRNCFHNIASHQNSDITLRDVTTTAGQFGRLVESNSRMEVLRGSNTANNVNYFIKNGQLQENDSTISAAINESIRIDGQAWIYLLRVDIAGTAGRNTFDCTGVPWVELDDCDMYDGNSGFVGTVGTIRLSNGTRVSGFTSSPFGIEFGYVETNGLCHIYDNNFVSFVSRGTPVFNLDNCDANAAAGAHDGANGSPTLSDSGESWRTDELVGFTINNVTDGSSGSITANTATTITATLSGGTDNDWDSGDTYTVVAPNTNGVRIEGGATSVRLDPRVTITSADKILSRPTSGLIFKETSPPGVSVEYYERGAIVLNEAAATGQPAFWICTTRGYGGTAVFTAGPNL